MKKWQYFQKYYDGLPTATDLDYYGNMGWELVNLIETKRVPSLGICVYFKLEVKED